MESMENLMVMGINMAMDTNTEALMSMVIKSVNALGNNGRTATPKRDAN